MTTCSQAERLLPLLYDGELAGPLRREVTVHVSGCAVCTRTLGALERGQELLGQALDAQIEEIDFSHFWDGVVSKLSQPQLPWTVRWQLWRERRWSGWSLRAPGWAVAAAVLLIITTVFLSRISPPKSLTATPEQKTEQFAALANNQAQIESLSAGDTVLLWNEPASNATVIWVSDENDGEMP